MFAYLLKMAPISIFDYLLFVPSGRMTLACVFYVVKMSQASLGRDLLFVPSGRMTLDNGQHNV